MGGWEMAVLPLIGGVGGALLARAGMALERRVGEWRDRRSLAALAAQEAAATAAQAAADATGSAYLEQIRSEVAGYEHVMMYGGAFRRALPLILCGADAPNDNYVLLWDGPLGFAYSVAPDARSHFSRRLRELAAAIELGGDA